MLAFNQKPQPLLGQYGQAVVLAQWQIFQRLGLAGPQGRPSSKVENSATVQAPLLGHFVAAVVVASDCMPVMLNLLACAWKFRRAARTHLPGSLLAGWLTGWLAAACFVTRPC